AIHPDDAERVTAEWKKAAGAERDSVAEYRFLRPDGSVVWIQGFASARRDETGRITGWVGTIVDLTVRKQAEEAAAQANELFRAAFENAPIGIALTLTTPEDRWLQVNTAFCELVGYSEEELLGLTIADLTHPEDLERDVAESQSLLDGATRSYSMEKRYVRPDGSLVWVMLSVSLVRDSDGAPLYFVAQVQDIGDRKRTEAESARLLA